MAAMRPYVIKQGDYLTKLAYTRGFDADEVWSAPENAELRQARPSKDILYPGDVIYLPQTEPTPQTVQGGTSNDYAASAPLVTVELLVRDGDRPVADATCEVQGLSGGGAESMKTDGDGRLEVKVPVTIREFTVTFAEPELAFNVRVGDLDPLSEQAGVVKRLQNLGYLPDMTDATEDDVAEMLPIALHSFQLDQGMTATGELCDATREAIGHAHGV